MTANDATRWDEHSPEVLRLGEGTQSPGRSAATRQQVPPLSSRAAGQLLAFQRAGWQLLWLNGGQLGGQLRDRGQGVRVGGQVRGGQP